MSREAPSTPTSDRLLISSFLLALFLLISPPLVAAGSIFSVHYLVQADETTATVRQIKPEVCDKSACWVASEISWQDEGQLRVGPIRGGPTVDVDDDPQGTTLLGLTFPVRYRHGDREPVMLEEAYYALLFTAIWAFCFIGGCASMRRRVRDLRASRDRAFRGVPEPGAELDIDPERRVCGHEIRLVATGKQKDRVAELLRTRCGLTSRDARERVHRAPTAFQLEATPVAALDTVNALRRAGAVVELRLVPRATEPVSP